MKDRENRLFSFMNHAYDPLVTYGKIRSET